MEFYCIDRLEEGFAVCETPNDRMENIPLEELPNVSAEGDLLPGSHTEKTCGFKKALTMILYTRRGIAW